ncbi:hypothetical protein SISNIDRAFT_447705 [Sistotremastrum niveocremeum HHB9708]|uniref:Crossover junction endonuclease MUS81 n=1 Tax=Sistotremastrum niveocremeum HHB9708 TaxID=1314777 RepID=A0A165AEK2_9AGAM|nr:hypothetical protein SISNIDRAFT_447705 [Sistotremastrum niveocremeum HHB9708]
MVPKDQILEWLLEWRDEAEEKGNKWNAHNKAYKSLLETPDDELYTIDDLIHVKFIGKNLLERIKKKMNGQEPVRRGQGGSSQSKGKGKRKSTEGDTQPAKRARTTSDDASQAENRPPPRASGTRNAAAGPSAPKSSGRRYDFNSIAAGVEGLGFFTQEQDDSGPVVATKTVTHRYDPNEILRSAQQKAPDPWETRLDNQPRPQTSTSSSDGAFKFNYLDTEDRRVDPSSKACVKIGAEGLLFKIEYQQSQASHPNCQRLVDKEPFASGKLIAAWLSEDDPLATPTCNGFTSPSVAERGSKPTAKKTLTELLAEEEAQRPRTNDPSRQLPLANNPRRQNTVVPQHGNGAADTLAVNREKLAQAALARRASNVNSLTATKSDESANSILQRTHTAPSVLPSSSTKTSDPTPPPIPPIPRRATTQPTPVDAPVRAKANGKFKPAPRVSDFVPPPLAFQENEHAIHEAAGIGAGTRPRLVDLNPTTFPSFDPIEIPPYDYEVYLVLDTREIKNQQNRDYIEDKLMKRGIKLLRKALALGDVTWVARRKSDGELFALDYILERKRLDDLCGSIKDGRFHDQKFRLGQSAITHVFYLVEEYDPAKFKEFFDLQINTALSQTLVIDNFIVQETRSLQFTIDYLVRLHEKIIQNHENETLRIIPPHMLKRHSYVALQKHLRSNPSIRTPHSSQFSQDPQKGVAPSYLISYADFDSLNSKSGLTTVRECWARMLLCIRGMSPEKVAMVIDRYPYPRALWEAFRAAEGREEGRGDLGLGDSEGESLGGGGGDSMGQRSSRKGKARGKAESARELLCGLGEAKVASRRKIGQALSGQVYELFVS